MDKAMEPWLNLITNFGLATMILICIGFCAWQSLRWIASQIIIPVRDHLFVRITNFFDRVDKTIANLEANIEKMSSHLEKQANALKDLHDRVTAITAAVEELRSNKRSH